MKSNFNNWLELNKNDENIKRFFDEDKIKGYSGGFKTWAKNFYSKIEEENKKLEKVFEKANECVSNFVTLNGKMHDIMILKKRNEFQTALLVYDDKAEQFAIGSQLGQVMKETNSELVLIMQEVIARSIDEKNVESIKNDSVQRELERPIYYPESMRDNWLRFMIIDSSRNIVSFAKKFKYENDKVIILDNEFVYFDISQDLSPSTKDFIEGFCSAI
jgi:isocitrate dehydrogenase